ncbi:MAG TPA: serine hydroxymethyltransferase [Acetobacteraceae bacterium]|nr:serine hydroxymethyltransferase [Acetobacteraceae bacterium]
MNDEASSVSPRPVPAAFAPGRFFSAPLAETDPELAAALATELAREQDGIELIASENLVSAAVLEAQGSVLTNKYAEGYPGRRYYGGCAAVDIAEELAINRARQLFGCGFANVQPHSGAQANEAVFLALLKPGDTILGMSLAAGGHLTHGAAPNISGKWFHAVQYGVRREDGLLDYEELERLAEQEKPKLIIAGGSAYPRFIDFARIRRAADAVGAYLMVDMAHFAGLVAAGLFPSPLPHAHVVTTTTHKTLRGPRGGMILANDPEIGKKINSAIFPGLQGGPLMHVIAAKAAAFGEALRPEFRAYQRSVQENARVLAETLAARGLSIVTGGTDCHLLLVDLRPRRTTGKAAEASLERARITANKNAIPFDPEKPTVTSGIRLGSPAATSRGFGTAEFREIGLFIDEVLTGLATSNDGTNSAAEESVGARVRALCARFPIYPRA